MTHQPGQADILLINPPSGLFYGLGPNFAPIGLFSLAAFLQPHGFSTTILNANYYPDYQNAGHLWSGGGQVRPDEYYYAEDYDNPVWEQVLAFIERVNPKLVGFSCHDLAVGGIKHLAGIIKSRRPDRLIAAGGPTPSGAADIFDDCLAVDYLLAGEGEVTLLALVQVLRDQGWRPPPPEPLKDITGLYFRDGGKFVFNGPRPRLDDLDALPDPVRTYYWLDYQRGQSVRDVQLNGVATSRGCLKACRFCGAGTIWPGPVRFRSIGRVINEIAELRRTYGYDFQHFSIFDDDFIAHPDRVLEFCRRLKVREQSNSSSAALVESPSVCGEALPLRGDDYKFRCYGRVNNLLNEELIETLLQAGCQEIWVGVESGSQKVLKALGKGITVEQIKRLDRLFKNYDFPWLAFIILGTPPEDESDIRLTLDMLKNGCFPAIQPFTFQPYTGTDLFRELAAEGRLEYRDIIRGHQNLPQCFSRLVEPARFFELLDELNQLGRDRSRSWHEAFYLTEAETEAAQQWERKAATWLDGRTERFLAVGPERQLRWLAALSHYQSLKADLRLVDMDAEANNSARFGQILRPRDAAAESRDHLLIVAPDGQDEIWRARAEAMFPGLPSLMLGQNAGEPPSPRYWRQVADLCRCAAAKP